MTFLWSDAWILQAVAVASRSGAAPLADVIAAADAVNHALPMHDELHGALCRLTRGGFVKEVSEGFAIGPNVAPEIGQAIATVNAFEGQKAASDLLAAEPWTSRTNTRDPRNSIRYEGLTDDHIRAAEHEYHRRGPG
jgi:hypothetical protein